MCVCDCIKYFIARCYLSTCFGVSCFVLSHSCLSICPCCFGCMLELCFKPFYPLGKVFHSGCMWICVFVWRQPLRDRFFTRHSTKHRSMHTNRELECTIEFLLWVSLVFVRENVKLPGISFHVLWIAPKMGWIWNSKWFTLFFNRLLHSFHHIYELFSLL